MRICRKCPVCSGEVRVMKTMSPVSTSERTEKLQLVTCLGCGLKGQVTVTSETLWLKPALVSTDYNPV